MISIQSWEAATLLIEEIHSPGARLHHSMLQPWQWCTTQITSQASLIDFCLFCVTQGLFHSLIFPYQASKCVASGLVRLRLGCPNFSAPLPNMTQGLWRASFLLFYTVLLWNESPEPKPATLPSLSCHQPWLASFQHHSKQANQPHFRIIFQLANSRTGCS